MISNESPHYIVAFDVKIKGWKREETAVKFEPIYSDILQTRTYYL